ncbi:UDP-N-acetylglucosamine:LPS N-acetylglucosamine transferase [Deinococcus peraridilitoris DSM 19664]|uniref:UDP-N-acetylglucosamine:LPS N-acetylglucosamine transferase n=2 Tax=Deinococcus TaxID=1298 RepID=L0A2N7_DEIPD|nr:UDP-N-acetylglucosamine:LPS N-acetylglucosamine transferase [Deinococcus peraridilitoris DSM 19664]
MRALIVSAALGGGHLKAAEALERALAEYSPGFNALHADYLTYLNPVERGVSAGVYLWWLRHSPNTYRFFYHWSDRAEAPWFVKSAASTAGLRRMLRDLRRVRPHLVLSSYDGPAVLAHTARRRHGLSFLNALLVTDYTIHYHWARPEVDFFMVATDRVKDGLVGWGIDPEKIAVTGIPILPRYAELQGADKMALRERFGLPQDEPLVLVSAGGKGSIYHGLSDVIDACAGAGTRVQVLLLAGGGEVGTEQVGGATVHRLGYTSFFPELLAASDLVIGKAGGLTVSEAIALGVPMLIYQPIPGQEEGNAAFLQERGAALWAPSKWELRRSLVALLGDPAHLQAMSEAARATGRPHAARDAAQALLRRLGAWE